MSYMIEIYYGEPVDVFREARITELVERLSGSITFREEPESHDVGRAICLTAEFETMEAAEKAFESLQSIGEHVEGPCDY
jgi:hypothetical protein